VRVAQQYYHEFGFHTSEYADTADGDDVFLAFMHITSHDHDIAFVKKDQPGLQHASFWMDNWHDVIRVADVVADAGFKQCIEFGPGRHKATNALFIYLLDPSGNRLEFFTGGSWVPDMDAPAIRWGFDDYISEGRLAWGDKAPESFRTQFSPVKSMK
jgi:catechol 2,3-dioxygenase